MSEFLLKINYCESKFSRQTKNTLNYEPGVSRLKNLKIYVKQFWPKVQKLFLEELLSWHTKMVDFPGNSFQKIF